MKDMQGIILKEGDVVAKPEIIGNSAFLTVRRVVKVQDEKIYLNSEDEAAAVRQPLRNPERVRLLYRPT